MLQMRQKRCDFACSRIHVSLLYYGIIPGRAKIGDSLTGRERLAKDGESLATIPMLRSYVWLRTNRAGIARSGKVCKTPDFNIH